MALPRLAPSASAAPSRSPDGQIPRAGALIGWGLVGDDVESGRRRPRLRAMPTPAGPRRRHEASSPGGGRALGCADESTPVAEPPCVPGRVTGALRSQ
jgi:hypothetical protein